ncbi:MAG: hypothetical protein WCL00_15655, partial [Bacteroidota bacterium]
SAFIMTDAQATSMQPTGHNITFTTSGFYNVSNAAWKFSATNNQIFQWNVYAPDSVKTLFMPEISASIKRMFPVLSPDSLSFDNLQLRNFIQEPTYFDLIQQLFINTQPVSIDHLECAWVRIVQGK